MTFTDASKYILIIIGIALRLFLTLPVTVATCERSFSKLKPVMNE